MLRGIIAFGANFGRGNASDMQTKYAGHRFGIFVWNMEQRGLIKVPGI